MSERFSVEETPIEGVIVYLRHPYVDLRGVYDKNYEKEELAQIGIFDSFTEASDIYSKKGVLRGLHYQSGCVSQSKLIRVIKGVIFDVCVDLRIGSKTFGRVFSILLKAGDMRSVYIPRDFAHGFLALDDDTVFSYMSAGEYIPSHAGGIRWDSPELEIDWPIREYGINELIMTEKDKAWPTFDEYANNLMI